MDRRQTIRSWRTKAQEWSALQGRGCVCVCVSRRPGGIKKKLPSGLQHKVKAQESGIKIKSRKLPASVEM